MCVRAGMCISKKKNTSPKYMTHCFFSMIYGEEKKASSKYDQGDPSACLISLHINAVATVQDKSFYETSQYRAHSKGQHNESESTVPPAFFVESRHHI